MRNSLLKTILGTSLALTLLPATSIAAPGDPGNVLRTLTINNVTGDGRNPTTPQGITMHDGFLWVVDFGTDRIYRVYPEDTYDDMGTPNTGDDVLLFNAGDSDLNLPITDTDNPPINSDGIPIGTCGAEPAGQYCGGGGLTFAENYLWNASPITDDIIKIDPVDGDNLESENALAGLAFPSPTDMTYDGNSFWIVDWQTNTINKVRPEDGALLLSLPGPSTLPSYQSNPSVTNARPFGITWDGRDLWVSDQEEQKIYRVDPSDGTVVDFFDTPGADPKGLSWNGELLWHADQATGTLYAVETGVIPFGITGCLEKNGVPINADVILSQFAQADQPAATDIDGCFQFATFTAGTPVQIRANEQGLDEKPVITLTETSPGETSVTLIVGDVYSEPGYSAIDTEDGDLTASVVARPNVIDTPTIIDTSTPNPTGVEVEYDVVDSYGNNADTVTRTVYVLEADIIPPVITLIGDDPVYVEQLSTYEEPGATAIDARDGDISANITISGTVNTNIDGTYSLSYDVSDAAGNAATTVTRQVIVQDTTVPTITLLGSNPINLEKGDTFVDPGATANDNVEGDISGRITTGGTVSTGETGSYVITYDVTDAQGNAAVTATRTVIVADTAAPVITLIGDALINHELNTAFTDPGATATDVPNQNITNSIVVTGSVNENVPGTYSLNYDVTDPDGNAATTVIRTVVVADTGTPTITLVGDNPLIHERGTTFTDPGATASDSIDGNITTSIVVTGSVDENTSGSYTLDYNVSDSAGNPAPTVSRTVNVGDSTPPIITLLGNANIQHELQTPYSDAGATATDNTGGDLTSSIVVGGDTVNTNTTGVYTITYNVSDAEGNPAAPISRVVDVADRTAPTITLNGNNPLNHEVGTVFVDPGASATDIIDGNISPNIGVSGTVDAGTVGSYTLYYNVSDAAGNNAATVSRTVNVQDTGAPSITLLGANPLLHELQTTYTDPGATASDAADGDLTSSINVSGSVNSNTAGTYTLNYNVVDSQSNPAPQQSRTVIVADRTPPTITLIGASTVSVEQGSSYSDAGATASDIIDGNLSSSIAVNGTVNVNSPGTYPIRYNVSDAAGNAAAEVVRTVIVSDSGAPVITLVGDNPLNHEVGTIFVDPGATATDAVDGNLSSSIGVSGTVDANTVGTYFLDYNVTDSAGNPATTVTRTVTVADTGAPTITITGDNPVLHEINTPYTDQGATASDVVDGDLTSSITTGGSVNTSVAGSYSITYDVVDSGGNPAAQRVRTVTVDDYTPPVITLSGSPSVNVELNTSYTDAGATASDNLDGDLTSSIITTGSVDVFNAGTYVLYYNVSDAAGNNATQVQRTIIVGDSSAPTITLVGASTLNHEQGTAYTDPGATASDIIDGDLTSSIVVSGFVNANASGSYTLNYNVTDSAGNDAPTISRTVVVADTTAPVINAVGSLNISHELDTPYVDEGATASDTVDGSLTSSIVTTGSVDSSTSGTYQIRYNVSDNAGNAATEVVRNITVEDTTPPVITLAGAALINHEQGTTFTDPGATATDTVDGSVTVNISGVVDINTAGTYTLNYDAQDAAGNNAITVSRDVVVSDTIAPTITLVGDSVIDHTSGSPFTDPGYSANDNIDGDITSDVVVTYDTSATTYILSYNVSDSAGNPAPEVQRTVNVVTPSTISIEAETATIGGSHTVETTETGFTGSGYIVHSGEGYIEYTFTAYGVPYDLSVRYALDTGDLPLEVILNSTSQGNLAFPATGSFAIWGNTANLTVVPNSGSNTLRLQTTGVSGANIDQITLTPQ